MANIIQNKYSSVFVLILIIAVGAATSIVSKLAFIIGVSFFAYGLLQTITKRNRNGEAHLYAAFIMGAEVYFRMSWSGLPWEFGKLVVFILLSTGLIVERLKKPLPILYILYLIMMLPAIFIPDWADLAVFKKEFMFTFFGQLVLVVSVFYFYSRTFTMDDLLKIGRWMLYGLMLMASLLYLKTPDYTTIHYGGGANFAASGGFGPNQVAAMLGLGTTVIGYFLLIQKRIFRWFWLDIVVLFIFTFQGMITFSRGGLFSAIIALVGAIVTVYLVSPKKAAKLLKINFIKLLVLFAILSGAYLVTNNITGGALEKRYTNEDEYGNQIKEDYSTKRIDIILEDIETFKENMFTGAGIGGGRALREQTTGISAAHVEFSRMLAEHGILGLFSLMIMFLYPLYRFFKIDDVLTRFTLIIFTGYGLLTMSHNALRLAMPSFMYGFGFIIIVWQLKQNRGQV